MWTLRSLILSLSCLVVLLYPSYASTTPSKSVVDSNGTVYEWKPAKVQLQPGEFRHIGEKCEFKRTAKLRMQYICTWKETIRATENGVERLPGGSEAASTILTPDAVLILGSVTLMALAIVLFKFGHEHPSFFMSITATGLSGILWCLYLFLTTNSKELFVVSVSLCGGWYATRYIVCNESRKFYYASLTSVAGSIVYILWLA